jgi:disulfide bond formation protein DsbB
MDRIFLGAAVVGGIVALRLVFIIDPVVGALVSYGAALAFMVIGGRYVLRNAPNEGWDPRTIEAARRRSDGLE